MTSWALPNDSAGRLGTDTVGSSFAFRGNHEGRNVHRSQVEVTELVPGERVAWHVVDNWMGFIDDQSEWQDTRIVFEISPTAGGAQIRFSHLGLVPAYECYDVCFNAWTFFIQDSLRRLRRIEGHVRLYRLLGLVPAQKIQRRLPQ